MEGEHPVKGLSLRKEDDDDVSHTLKFRGNRRERNQDQGIIQHIVENREEKEKITTRACI